MHIKVFGPGCARCAETEKRVHAAVAAQGTRAGAITVEKVSDLKEMMLMGILATPAVAVDGVVKSTGRVPAKEEIAAWINKTLPPATPSCGCKATE
ncbi:MAG: thioredoxin family protein [Desulfobulbus sp.]|jgi:small redox-active disulfide protein 2|nr:thioredoxin family protein [Desulfobulbaceae bacterium]